VPGCQTKAHRVYCRPRPELTDLSSGSSFLTTQGGLVESTIKFIPPKQSVEFTTAGNGNAPAMTVESGVVPDPLDAKISAEWDR